MADPIHTCEGSHAAGGFTLASHLINVHRQHPHIIWNARESRRIEIHSKLRKVST